MEFTTKQIAVIIQSLKEVFDEDTVHLINGETTSGEMILKLVSKLLSLREEDK